MANAVFTEVEKLGKEAEAIFEKIIQKIKAALPKEHHDAVDKAVYISDEASVAQKDPTDETKTVDSVVLVSTTNVDTTTPAVGTEGEISTTGTK